jgi:cell division protein FtsB
LPKLPRFSAVQVVLVLAIIAVGYFAFSAVGGTLLSQRVNDDEQQLRREVAALQEDRAQLEAIREYLWTDEYVEGVARRLLGLVREGESLVIVSPSATATPASDTPDDTDPEPRTWWERLYIP